MEQFFLTVEGVCVEPELISGYMWTGEGLTLEGIHAKCGLNRGYMWMEID